ncbi:MAG: RluA family pseudouridine synthase [Verrucomicrobia bacterium]|nr:RluA family pseudouridine synthase [Verrucomicrobiota bacterium]
MKLSFKVSGTEGGMKLLYFLRDHCAGSTSVKALKRAIDGKKCRINGRIETFSTHPLNPGDIVEIDLETPAKKTTLRILFEDDELCICEKPSGVTCTPENFSALLVHRLDKETSGVLILAKTESMRQKMTALFADKALYKAYVAIVDGRLTKEKGTITTRLAKKHTYQGQTIYGSAAKGQLATTNWEVLKAGKKASLLLCEPQTGRTHQIRVHLKEMGHPILGDTQYAKKFTCPFEASRVLLHAYRVRFQHPTTGEEVDVSNAPPEDFLLALEELDILFENF